MAARRQAKDAEFTLGGDEEEEDDETTLAAEEAAGGGLSAAAELADLEAEQEQCVHPARWPSLAAPHSTPSRRRSMEALLAMREAAMAAEAAEAAGASNTTAALASGSPGAGSLALAWAAAEDGGDSKAASARAGRGNGAAAASKTHEEGASEASGAESEEDDETTLAAEEALAAAEGGAGGGAEEAAQLTADAEVPMEELIAQWQAAVAAEEGAASGPPIPNAPAPAPTPAPTPAPAPAPGKKEISKSKSKGKSKSEGKGKGGVGVLAAARSRTQAGRSKAKAAAAAAFHKGMTAHFKTQDAETLRQRRRELIARVKGLMHIDDGSVEVAVELAKVPCLGWGFGHPTLVDLVEEEERGEPWVAPLPSPTLPQVKTALDPDALPPKYPPLSNRVAAPSGEGAGSAPPSRRRASAPAPAAPRKRSKSSSASVMVEAQAEPEHETSHWEALLAEAKWMAADFADERKRKQRLRRAIVADVARAAERKAQAAVVTARRAESDRRAAAAAIAKGVAGFWGKLDRLVVWKHRSRLEAMRRDAMDRHLNFLVGQSERYSSVLADQVFSKPALPDASQVTGVAGPAVPGPPPASSRTAHQDGSDSESDDAVLDKGHTQAGGAESEEDDETTLAAEEALAAAEGGAGGGAEEAAQLTADAEVPMEELIAQWQAAVAAEAGSDSGSAAAATDGASHCSDSGSDDGADAASPHAAASSSALTSLVQRPLGQGSDGHAVQVPFLLHGGAMLRSYQREGLDWLVSMHDRRLNGILADEMGLGKTLQTIALLAHLASHKCVWGPHLIIAPTSTLLNWEAEFRRWCPAFRVLTYYGSIKERKAKRAGWSRPDAFNVCITSYQLAVADAAVFKRKRWYAVVLDEGHYIRNFKSKRWQTLLTLPSARRLLLTGTPLQNNLLELWSLMHFLMPQLFRSQAEFKEWFATPLTEQVEGGPAMDPHLIARLHTVLRPFMLRRLKADVAKQLPGKHEHIIRCTLAKRQRLMYEDYMGRSSTRAALTGVGAKGGMSMMNVLMQLRKVCNHPDLFQARPITSPLNTGSRVFTFPTSIMPEHPLGPPLGQWGDTPAALWQHPSAALGSPPFTPLIGVGAGGHARLAPRSLPPADVTPAFLHGRVLWPGLGMYRTGTGTSGGREGGAWCPHGGGGAANLAVRGLTPFADSCIVLGGGRTLRVAPLGTPNAFACRAVHVPEHDGAEETQEHGGALMTLDPAVGWRAVGPRPAMNGAADVKVCTHRVAAPPPRNLSDVPLGERAWRGGAPPVFCGAPPLPLHLLRCGVDLAHLGLLFTPAESDAASGSYIAQRAAELAPPAEPEHYLRAPLRPEEVVAGLVGMPTPLIGAVSGTLQRAFVAEFGQTPQATTPSGGKKRPRNTPRKPGTLTWSALVSACPEALSRHLVLLHAALTARRLESARQRHASNMATSAHRIACLGHTVWGSDAHRAMWIGPGPLRWAAAVADGPAAVRDLLTPCAVRSPLRQRAVWAGSAALAALQVSPQQRHDALLPILRCVACVVPAARAEALVVRVGVGGALAHRRALPPPSPPPLIRHMPPGTAGAAANAGGTLSSNVERAVAPAHVPPTVAVSRLLHQAGRQLCGTFHSVHSRLSLGFPGRHLLQHDCGKLQALARLLRQRKAGGSKVLIFTQMTRMLDILEAWLNVAGHTYLRLDGSTGVEERQRSMDAFNSDPRIFAFILTTRAGGLGINLVGADTVIFYDTDWNPAMDAQAQDRAHRIGQTREVHIYRLVTAATVEENILLKAAQKREMSRISLEEGSFTLNTLKASRSDAPGAAPTPSLDMAGVLGDGAVDLRELVTGQPSAPGTQTPTQNTPSADLMAAMAAAEDAEDVQAGAALQAELASADAEFREEAPAAPAAGEGAGAAPSAPDAMVPQGTPTFAEHSEGGSPPPGLSRVEAALARYASISERVRPVERLGLVFREHTEPHPWVAPKLLAELEAEFELAEEEWELDQVAAARAEETAAAEANAELVAMGGRLAGTLNASGRALRGAALQSAVALAVQAGQRVFFARLRALRARRLRRAVTGECWALRRDTTTGSVFYMNTDDGSDCWGRPPVLRRGDELFSVASGGWGRLPQLSRVAVTLMTLLGPGADRAAAACVGPVWAAAAQHPLLHVYVSPLAQHGACPSGTRVAATLREAVQVAAPGDTVVLGLGSHYERDPPVMQHPIRIVAEGCPALSSMSHVTTRCPSLTALAPTSPADNASPVAGQGGLQATFAASPDPGPMLRGMVAGSGPTSCQAWVLQDDWRLAPNGVWLPPGHVDAELVPGTGGGDATKGRMSKTMTPAEAQLHTRQGAASVVFRVPCSGYGEGTGRDGGGSGGVLHLSMGGGGGDAPLRETLLRLGGTWHWQAPSGVLAGVALRNTAPRRQVEQPGAGHLLTLSPGAGLLVTQCDLRSPAGGGAMIAVGMGPPCGPASHGAPAELVLHASTLSGPCGPIPRPALWGHAPLTLGSGGSGGAAVLVQCGSGRLPTGGAEGGGAAHGVLLHRCVVRGFGGSAVHVLQTAPVQVSGGVSAQDEGGEGGDEPPAKRRVEENEASPPAAPPLRRVRGGVGLAMAHCDVVDCLGPVLRQVAPPVAAGGATVDSTGWVFLADVGMQRVPGGLLDDPGITTSGGTPPAVLTRALASAAGAPPLAPPCITLPRATHLVPPLRVSQQQGAMLLPPTRWMGAPPRLNASVAGQCVSLSSAPPTAQVLVGDAGPEGSGEPGGQRTLVGTVGALTQLIAANMAR